MIKIGKLEVHQIVQHSVYNLEESNSKFLGITSLTWTFSENFGFPQKLLILQLQAHLQSYGEPVHIYAFNHLISILTKNNCEINENVFWEFQKMPLSSLFLTYRIKSFFNHFQMDIICQ